MNGILAQAFRDNREVTGILFPAGTPRPVHLATPAAAFSPRPDRSAAEVMAASGQRDVALEGAGSRRGQLGSPGAAVSEPLHGLRSPIPVGEPMLPMLGKGGLPIHHVIVGASLFGQPERR